MRLKPRSDTNLFAVRIGAPLQRRRCNAQTSRAFRRCASPFQLRVRITYFCQIRSPRARVQFAQQTVIARLRLQLRNLAIRIIDVPEDNGSRRTRLLAGGLQFVRVRGVIDLPVFPFRVHAALVDALHTVGALLHHAAAAHADVGIAHHLVLRRIPILEEQEVKAPHFIRAIVRAIARAHTAVIGHVVQAFAAVNGGADRAHHFAGRVLALLARHGLEIRLGIVAIAGRLIRILVVGVDTDPMHVAADGALFFADHRNVVFRLAGEHAIVAPHTGVQVNRHAPRVIFLFIRIRLVERESGRGVFVLFLREVGIVAVFLERAFARQRAVVAVGRVHPLIALRGGEHVFVAGLANLYAGGDPRIGAGAQRISVETLTGADAAGALAAVAQSDGDRIVGMPDLHPNRARNFFAVEFEFDYVDGFYAQAVGHLGTHEHGIVPGELRHRLGQFLQPAVVGELAVVDGGVATDVEFDGVGIGRARRGGCGCGSRFCA